MVKDTDDDPGKITERKSPSPVLIEKPLGVTDQVKSGKSCCYLFARNVGCLYHIRLKPGCENIKEDILKL